MKPFKYESLLLGVNSILATKSLLSHYINICGHTFPPEITGAVVTSSKGAGSQLQMTDTLVGAEIRYSHKTIVCRTVVAWPTETNRTVATIYMEQMKLCTSDRVGHYASKRMACCKISCIS